MLGGEALWAAVLYLTTGLAGVVLAFAVGWPLTGSRSTLWWIGNGLAGLGGLSFLLLARARGLLSVGWPGLCFVLVFGLFHFASLGEHPRGWYAPALREVAWLLCACSLLGWMCGYAIGRGAQRVRRDPLVRFAGGRLEPRDARVVAWLGALMFAAGLGMQYALVRGHGLSQFFEMGYMEVRHATAASSGNPLSYLYSLGQLVCTVGVTLTACATSLGRVHGFPRRWFVALVFSYAACLLALGDRSEVLVVVFPVLLVRHYYVKPFRLGHAVAIVLVVAMAFTGASIYRGSKRVEDFAAAALDPSELTRGMDEAGYTFDTVVRSMVLVPDRHPYFAGRTYLDAFARAWPNVTLTPRRWGFVSSEWVTRETAPRMHAKGEGLAFSIVAEAYINFGLWGTPLVLGLIGWLHARGERVLAGPRIALVSVVVYVLCEIALLLHVRNTVVMYLRGAIWMVVLALPVLLVVAVSRWTRRHALSQPASARLASRSVEWPRPARRTQSSSGRVAQLASSSES
ncbi:MAG: O-antigen polysaccharide polymerase Wzy [Myxococcales bacterium FL481]|nr:MAG: O-antigen polysaccharide polymerase Wzy [Myxococcales bacterium FL481]